MTIEKEKRFVVKRSLWVHLSWVFFDSIARWMAGAKSGRPKERSKEGGGFNARAPNGRKIEVRKAKKRRRCVIS